MQGNPPQKDAEDDIETTIDAIYYNIKLCNTLTVEYLLDEADVDINHADKDGRTPLSWAASYGSHEMVEILLTKATNIEADRPDHTGRTPLSWMAKSTDVVPRRRINSRIRVKAAKCLLARDDVDINWTDSSGRTPLSWAAGMGDRTISIALLANPRIQVNIRDNNDRSPLSWASEKGHTKIVRALMDREDIITDDRDKDGRVPLSWAAEHGHTETVREFANKFINDKENISITCRDHRGLAPISWAAEKGHFDTFKELLVFHRETMHSLVREGRHAVVKMAIRAGYDLASLDSEKRTMLQVSVQWNRVDIAKILLPGSPIDNKDSEDMTALDLAIRHGHRELIGLLLEQSAAMSHVRASKWFRVYRGSDIISLVEQREGRKYIRPITANEIEDGRPHASTGAYPERHVFLLRDHSASEKAARAWMGKSVPYKRHQSIGPSPYTFQIDIRPTEPRKLSSQNQQMNCYASALFRREQANGNEFDIPLFKDSRVMWTVVQSGTVWKPVHHFSMLQGSAIPNDGAELFTQFISELEKTWLELCSSADEHLSDCRLDQLREQGNSSELVYRLAKDAQMWTILRRLLRDNVQEATKFATSYCHKYQNGDGLQSTLDAINQLEKRINPRLDTLDETVRDLLQFVFI
ncbi:ankyrin repeat-containing domain protein [Ilyonectria sp. MPI-CAGE-AT-0026]|nr:ankyrin repeat-containing domain protein [Ilyonectria sp. MPI-CAGE-AT-0026]